MSDARLENLKLKLIFFNYLKLFIIWLGIWIQGPNFDGKNTPHFLCKYLYVLLNLKFGGFGIGYGIGPKPK